MNSFIANILRTDYIEINNPVKWIGVEPYCEQTTTQPVDCVVSAWSDWSACVNGFETRTRTVITPAQNGGIPCPILTENRSCVTQNSCVNLYYENPLNLPSPSQACPNGYISNVTLVFKLEDANNNPVVATEQIHIIIETDNRYISGTQFDGLQEIGLFIEIGQSQVTWVQSDNMLDDGQGNCGFEITQYMRTISIAPNKYNCVTQPNPFNNPVKWIGIEPYCETDEPSSSFDNSFDQSFG